MRLRRPVWLLLFGILSSLPSLAQAPVAARPAAVDRLARAGRLWGAVRYLHPWLAYKPIDWDAALVQAVPKIQAAGTPEEYAAAVQGMLDALGDPATRVAPPGKEPAAPAREVGTPPYRWLDEKTMVLDLRPYMGYSGAVKFYPRMAEFVRELRKAETLVVDLRAATAPGDEDGFGFILDNLDLARRLVRAPGQRYRLHSGYRPQVGGGSGGYWSGFVALDADSFGPAPQGAPGRVAFLVLPGTALPPVALALQAGGDGVLVSEGELADPSLVAHQTVDLGEGYEARVRVSELLPMPGWPGLHADARIPPGAGDEAALRAALDALAARKATAPAAVDSRVAPLPDAVFRPDEGYPEMLAPSLEYRVLAVVRAWNVIQYFYPYKHLIGDWDAVLPEFIGRMEQVHDASGYSTAVLEMMAHVADGHTTVVGHPEIDKLLGVAGPPVSVRRIEGRWVVIALGDDPAVKAASLQVGDVVTAVDGEPLEGRAERLRRIVPASTEGGYWDRVRRLLLSGPDGSTATLAIDREGAAREVKLQREKKYRGGPQPQPAGEAVRLLPGNLGYVDLTRLTVGEVDGMMEKLKGTRGIVFDMRGYPKGVFLALGSRFNTRGARVAATFRRTEVSAFSAEEEESGYHFSQPIPSTDKWKYAGKTVMLIDERAISQSEHTGLFLEAASGTRFVGTPTAGANGDITFFTLPGGITAMFTGHDVRHADGRQLQRVGLVPDLVVAPTLAGVRAGKDEVLDQGVEFLNQELAAAGSPAAPAAAPGTGGAGSSW
jgi:C-terminal processing protease CtpA/Prc